MYSPKINITNNCTFYCSISADVVLYRLFPLDKLLSALCEFYEWDYESLCNKLSSYIEDSNFGFADK